MASLICSYSRPVPYPGIANPTLPTHHWNFASSSCVFVGNVSTTAEAVNVQLGSSTFPIVANGFTYGELVIGVFAFLIWATLLFSMIWAFVMRIRVKL